MNYDLFCFALGALRGHRLRTALSVLGVAIGTAAVILLTSLGEGARLYVTSEFASLGSTLVIILPGKTETTGTAPIFGGTPNDLTLDDAQAVLRSVRGVRRIAPIALGAAEARAGEKSREVVVIGTTGEFAQVRTLQMDAGQFLARGELKRDDRTCVLGATIRTDLFGPRDPLGEFLHVGGARYRVIGVIAPTGNGIGGNINEMVFIPVPGAMRLFNHAGLFRVLVEVHSFDQITRVGRDITALLKSRHGGAEDITIFTQDAMLATFNNILQALTYALAGIAAISLAVAGIGIMNVMLVSVSERTREIGLLKALGADPAHIAGVFLLEAAILSVVGGLVGLGTGWGGSRLLRYLYPDFPASAPDWAIVAAFGVSLAVGVFFGAFPARRAARMDPVLALAKR